MKFCYMTSLTLPNNPKDPDLSYKTNLDFFHLFVMKKLSLITKKYDINKISTGIVHIYGNFCMISELESQLTAAETRCDLLEKQLDYMRTMVHSAEKDRHAAVSRVTFAEPKEQEPSLDFQTNLRKISELERQHIKLTANQSLAEVSCFVQSWIKLVTHLY